MKHLVQFSTGVGSAEVALRVWAEHGPASMALITADTRVEDEDNWRFAREVVATFMPDVPWYVWADGRTPMEVGRDERVVPNNRMAVCSRVLKRELIRKNMERIFDPAESIVYLGFDWTEDRRFAASVGPWEPWTIAAPLMDPPYRTKADLLDGFRARGIEPPRLYAQGFSHANCGGACVRGGQAQWELLHRVNQPRYVEWERAETQIRTELGKDVAILRDRTGGRTTPLSLRAFRFRLEATPTLFDGDDWGACGCTE